MSLPSVTKMHHLADAVTELFKQYGFQRPVVNFVDDGRKDTLVFVINACPEYFVCPEVNAEQYAGQL